MKKTYFLFLLFFGLFCKAQNQKDNLSEIVNSRNEISFQANEFSYKSEYIKIMMSLIIN